MLCKLGDVEFSAVTEENPEYKNIISVHAVESGQDVSDHVRAEQDVLGVSGVITGDDAAQKLSILLKYRSDGTLLSYIGRNGFYNVVIESLSTRHNVRVRDGLEFDMTLKQVRIAETREVQIAAPVQASAPALSSQVRPVQSVGLQQPKPVAPAGTSGWADFRLLSEASTMAGSWADFRQLDGA